MKYILLILFVLLTWVCQSQTYYEQVVNSTIESVTVYFKGAQITRKGNVNLKSGVTELVIKDLSPFLDPTTIQVKSESDFTLLSVNHRKNYVALPAQPQQLEKLTEAKQTLEDSIQYINTLEAILAEEENYLKSQLPRNQSEKNFDFEDYQQITAYYTEKIRKIKLEQLEKKRLLRSLQINQQNINRQISEYYNTKKDFSSEIVLKVQTLKALPITFQVGYLTQNASWTPSYDLKVENISSPIELLFKANVQQSTGEDWNNVLLTFTNTDPKKNSVAPSLVPYFLNYGIAYRSQSNIQPYDGSGKVISGRITDQSGEALIGANVNVKATNVGAVTDVNGYFQLAVPPGSIHLLVSYTGFESKEILLNNDNFYGLVLEEDSSMLEEVVVSSYSSSRRLAPQSEKETKVKDSPTLQTTTLESQTSVSFKLDIPYSIKSDGVKYTVNLQLKEVPALYSYQAVPKIDPTAYLTAKIVEWSQYDLLSGTINLYYENTFLGKSELDVKFLTDTLNISLGRDENVQVRREAVKELKKRNLIGGKISESRAYRVTVRNNKAQALEIEILDQIPVSNIKEIEVGDLDISNATLNQETGLLTWKIVLKPKELQERLLKYVVKYPSDKQILVR